MDAREPGALPSAPAFEIRELVCEEVREGSESRGRGRRVEDDLDQARKGVVLDDDNRARRLPCGATQRRFARSAALPM
jgi:hypothetical protein